MYHRYQTMLSDNSIPISSYDIYISTSESDSAFSKCLLSDLEKLDFKIAEYKKSGPFSYDDWSKAIENSDTFVFIISKSYGECARCRLEVAYAKVRKKHMFSIQLGSKVQIDNWLEDILSNDNHFIVNDGDDVISMDSVLEALTKSISSRTSSTNYSSPTESIVKQFIIDLSSLLSKSPNITNFSGLKHVVEEFYLFCIKTENVYDEIKSTRSLKLIGKLIKLLNDKRFFVNDDMSCLTSLCFDIVMLMTDQSLDATKDVLNTDIPDVLIAIILNESFINDIRSKRNYEILKSATGIVHNIVRNSGNENRFQIKELKESLVRFIEINDRDQLGISSLLTLSYLLVENEQHLLSVGQKTITYLINYIKKAVTYSDKKFNGLSLWEMLSGLHAISINDDMKEKIVENVNFQLLLDILKQTDSELEITHILGIIQNLCFLEGTRNKLVNDYQLLNLIKPFELHESKIIRKYYNGIIWEVEKKMKFLGRSDVVSTAAFNIFFSYCHEDKEIVMKLYNEFRKNNLTVWLDVDQMKYSTIEAMAEGIENSKVFVITISDAYKRSVNCRREAEYAIRMNKPIIPIIVQYKYKPTGWLGFVMGSKLYFEFSERRDFSSTLDELLKSVTDCLRIDEGIVKVVDRRQTERNGIQNWSEEDIEKWLNKNNLQFVKTKLRNLTVQFLVCIRNTLREYPQFVYEHLQNDFKLTFHEVLFFLDALRNTTI